VLVPFAALENAAAKAKAPIYSTTSEGVEVQWDDRPIPQRKTYPVNENAYRPEFPESLASLKQPQQIEG